MATNSNPRPAPDQLQFDRAVHAQAPDAATDAGLTCAGCGAALTTHYFHVADQPACTKCKNAAEQANHRETLQSRRAGVMLRAATFGLGAAIVGAVLYYAVIAITGWEIGLVAIVIGFMVGYAVRRGARGMGGRRYQMLAVGLTYFAVGLAYAPLAFKGFMETEAGKTALAEAKASQGSNSTALREGADSAAAAQSQNAPGQGEAQSEGSAAGHLALALGATFLFIFVLPVIYVVGSMPSGLISALIIVFGMQQAWRMTAKVAVPISGPYKVGRTPHAPPA
jgi:hypothetical protein